MSAGVVVAIAWLIIAAWPTPTEVAEWRARRREVKR